MKKIILNIAVAALSIGALSTTIGCRDALEIVQPGELNEETVFTSVANLDAFLTGSVYATMEPSYAIYVTSVITDEVKPGRGSGGQEFQLHRFFLDPSDGYTHDIWQNNYLIINRVNRLLRGAEKITPSAAEKEKYDNILAQARAIRAYAYLQLETYFSEDMKDVNKLGVMLVNNVPNINDQLPRVSNKEIYETIDADLNYAKSILTRGKSHYYVDLNFVEAVAARFNLYRGNYSEAKKNAESLLKNSGLKLTPATPIKADDSQVIGSSAWNSAFYATATSFNPYRNIWNDSQRGEVIFSLARQATGVGAAIGRYYNTNQSNYNGSPMWNVGRNLFNILNSTDGDIRRYAFVDPTSKIDPNYLSSTNVRDTDALIVDKYPGKTSAATRNDLKLFRLSEVYFILAEVAVRENNLLAAREYIHKVREARNYKGTAVTPVYMNAKEALQDILKERRVELAFEGHRYIDLKRLASEAGVQMDRNQTDDIVKVSNLPNGDHRYTLPIPQSEVAGNPTIQQNTGY